MYLRIAFNKAGAKLIAKRNLSWCEKGRKMIKKKGRDSKTQELIIFISFMTLNGLKKNSKVRAEKHACGREINNASICK